jgi:hypothetical protein
MKSGGAVGASRAAKPGHERLPPVRRPALVHSVERRRCGATAELEEGRPATDRVQPGVRQTQVVRQNEGVTGAVQPATRHRRGWQASAQACARSGGRPAPARCRTYAGSSST